MSTIRLNKKSFKDDFLRPAMRLGEEKCRLICTEDSIRACIKRPPDCTFLNSIVPVNNDFVGAINIASLSRIDRLVRLISDEEIVFDVRENHLVCKTDSFSYKMFFMSDEVMNQKNFNEDLLNKLDLPIEFEMTADEFKQLRALTRLADANYKVYFSQKDGKLVVVLTDRTNYYSNNLTLNLSASVDFTKDLILNSIALSTIDVGPDDTLSCRTDGQRLIVVSVGLKKYIFSLLLL